MNQEYKACGTLKSVLCNRGLATNERNVHMKEGLHKRRYTEQKLGLRSAERRKGVFEKFGGNITNGQS